MKEQQEKLNAYASMNTKIFRRRLIFLLKQIIVKYLLTAIPK